MRVKDASIVPLHVRGQLDICNFGKGRRLDRVEYE